MRMEIEFKEQKMDVDYMETCSSNRSMNAAEVRGPEPDAIKMFVGQIPRHMDENGLKKMFEDFGPVYQINVLRDKQTGQSKGCCFVTFYTRKAALDAQNAMHNIRTLPGMHHPIQMKPADSENRNERKLFVGMISKKCSENDVRLMFSSFGAIEECTVLRDANGQSRGCAFVTFASRQCAISAIKSMHQSQTMDGCSAPLVVKFADTPKEKDQRKLQTQLQQMTQNIWSMASLSNLNSLGPQQYLAVSDKAVAAAGSGGGTGLGGMSIAQIASNVNSHLQLQQLLAASLPNQTTGLTNLSSLQSGLSNSPTSANTDLAASNLQGLAALASMSAQGVGLNPMSVQNLAALAAVGSGGSSGMSPSGTLSSSSSPGSTLGALNGIGGSNSSLTGNGEGFTSSFPTIYSAFPSALSGLAGSGNQSKQPEGPDGANLFIYHLPQEFSDSDLAQTFMPFGNVLSAKVFIDKHTNLSKCFGFVSYDNPVAAQSAIQAMNGFQIGTKRLKVQLKRSKEAAKPY